MTQYDSQNERTVAEGPTAAAVVAADDAELRAGVAGLASMISGSGGLQALLVQVAQFATDAIPLVDGAGVSLLHDTDGPQQVQAWGAAADVVKEIDRIQYQLLDEGPCVTCMHTLRPAISGSVGSDERWPRFGGRVARLNVHSALSLPLVIHGKAIGAINCYAFDRDAFTEHAVALGEQFAGPAAVAVHNAQLLDAAATKAAQLQHALTSRATIDQAIGIVLSRTGGTPQQAFDRLKQISQHENVKLAKVAQHIVDEAIKRAQSRAQAPRGSADG